MAELVDKAIASAFAEVERCKKRLDAFKFATSGISDYDRDGIQKEVSILYNQLYTELARAYENVFMWGVIDPQTRLKAKQLAYKSFFNSDENCTYSNLIDFSTRRMPRGYSMDVEEVFKKEIQQLMQEVRDLPDKTTNLVVHSEVEITDDLQLPFKEEK